jgi:hypothetical protein
LVRPGEKIAFAARTALLEKIALAPVPTHSAEIVAEEKRLHGK